MKKISLFLTLMTLVAAPLRMSAMDGFEGEGKATSGRDDTERNSQQIEYQSDKAAASRGTGNGFSEGDDDSGQAITRAPIANDSSSAAASEKKSASVGVSENNFLAQAKKTTDANFASCKQGLEPGRSSDMDLSSIRSSAQPINHPHSSEMPSELKNELLGVVVQREQKGASISIQNSKRSSFDIPVSAPNAYEIHQVDHTSSEDSSSKSGGTFDSTLEKANEDAYDSGSLSSKDSTPEKSARSTSSEELEKTAKTAHLVEIISSTAAEVEKLYSEIRATNDSLASKGPPVADTWEKYAAQTDFIIKNPNNPEIPFAVNPDESRAYWKPLLPGMINSARRISDLAETVLTRAELVSPDAPEAVETAKKALISSLQAMKIATICTIKAKHALPEDDDSLIIPTEKLDRHGRKVLHALHVPASDTGLALARAKADRALVIAGENSLKVFTDIFALPDGPSEALDQACCKQLAAREQKRVAFEKVKALKFFPPAFDPVNARYETIAYALEVSNEVRNRTKQIIELLESQVEI